MKKIATNNYIKLVISQVEDEYVDTEMDNNVEEYYTDDAADDELEEAMNAEDLESSYYNADLPTLTQEDLETMTIDEDDEDLEASESKDIVEPEGYPDFATVFQAVRWAKHNHETMRVNYITLSGINIVRDVEPHGDFFAKTTHRRSVVCWDQTVGGIRSYILDRITPDALFEEGYKFTGEKFSPKFNFSRTRSNFLRRLRRRKDRKENK